MAQAATTSASDSCNATVVDATSGHVLGSQQAINSAAQPLLTAGLTLRVRAFDTAPDGSLNQYVDNMVTTCATWRGPDGKIAGNMVVIAFSLDHQDGLEYGGNLSQLKPDVDGILKAMGVQFRGGNFENGVVVAEQDVMKVVNGGSVSDGNTSSGGSSAAGKVFGIVVFAIVCLGGLFVLLMVLVFFVGKGKKEKQRTAAAKARAIQARTDAQGAVDLIATVEGGADATTVQLILSQLGEATAAELNATWSDAETRAQEAYDARDALVEAGASRDPSRVHSRDDYVAIEKAWNGVKAKAETAVQASKSVGTRCTELDHAIKNAPATLTALRRTLAETRQQYQTAVSGGLQIAGGAYFEDASAALDQASGLIQRQQVGAALDQFEIATAACAHVTQQVADERERQARIARIASTAHADVDGLETRLDEIGRAIGERHGQVGFGERVEKAREIITALRARLDAAEPDYLAFATALEEDRSTINRINSDSERAHRRATAPRPTTTYRSSSGGYGSSGVGTGIAAGLIMDDLLRNDGGFGNDPMQGGGDPGGGFGNW